MRTRNVSDIIIFNLIFCIIVEAQEEQQYIDTYKKNIIDKEQKRKKEEENKIILFKETQNKILLKEKQNTQIKHIKPTTNKDEKMLILLGKLRKKEKDKDISNESNERFKEEDK